LLAECRMLLREVAKSSGKAIHETTIERKLDTSSSTPEKQ